MNDDDDDDDDERFAFLKVFFHSLAMVDLFNS